MILGPFLRSHTLYRHVQEEPDLHFGSITDHQQFFHTKFIQKRRFASISHVHVCSMSMYERERTLILNGAERDLELRDLSKTFEPRNY